MPHTIGSSSTTITLITHITRLRLTGERGLENGSVIRDIIRSADPACKARIYNQLELRLTYQPGQNRVHAQANLNPSGRGGMGSVRGPIDPTPPHCSISYGADIDLQHPDAPCAL